VEIVEDNLVVQISVCSEIRISTWLSCRFNPLIRRAGHFYWDRRTRRTVPSPISICRAICRLRDLLRRKESQQRIWSKGLGLVHSAQEVNTNIPIHGAMNGRRSFCQALKKAPLKLLVRLTGKSRRMLTVRARVERGLLVVSSVIHSPGELVG
jgi:hypothetical protein